MKKSISLENYTKLCNGIIAKGKSVEDTLIELLEIAGKYKLGNSISPIDTKYGINQKQT
jgi:hypothetical protein